MQDSPTAGPAVPGGETDNDMEDDKTLFQQGFEIRQKRFTSVTGKRRQQDVAAFGLLDEYGSDDVLKTVGNTCRSIADPLDPKIYVLNALENALDTSPTRFSSFSKIRKDQTSPPVMHLLPFKKFAELCDKDAMEQQTPASDNEDIVSYASFWKALLLKNSSDEQRWLQSYAEDYQLFISVPVLYSWQVIAGTNVIDWSLVQLPFCKNNIGGNDMSDVTDETCQQKPFQCEVYYTILTENDSSKDGIRKRHLFGSPKCFMHVQRKGKKWSKLPKTLQTFLMVLVNNGLDKDFKLSSTGLKHRKTWMQNFTRYMCDTQRSQRAKLIAYYQAIELGKKNNDFEVLEKILANELNVEIPKWTRVGSKSFEPTLNSDGSYSCADNFQGDATSGRRKSLGTHRTKLEVRRNSKGEIVTDPETGEPRMRCVHDRGIGVDMQGIIKTTGRPDLYELKTQLAKIQQTLFSYYEAIRQNSNLVRTARGIIFPSALTSRSKEDRLEAIKKYRYKFASQQDSRADIYKRTFAGGIEAAGDDIGTTIAASSNDDNDDSNDWSGGDGGGERHLELENQDGAEESKAPDRQRDIGESARVDGLRGAATSVGGGSLEETARSDALRGAATSVGGGGSLEETARRDALRGAAQSVVPGGAEATIRTELFDVSHRPVSLFGLTPQSQINDEDGSDSDGL